MKMFLWLLVYNCVEKYIVLLLRGKEIRGKMKRSISFRCGRLIVGNDIERCLVREYGIGK